MRNFLRVLTALIFFLTAATHSESAVRLGVTTFQSGSGSVNTGQLELITDSFINTIAGSRAITVLERSRFDTIAREQKMSLSGLVDTETAVKIGKLSSCNYIITGSVYIQEEANITVRVVDVSTGQIHFSMSETSQSPQVSSLITSASLLGNRVREELVHEYAYVSDINGRNISINRGSKDGVHRGDLYRVYTEGTEIYDNDGKVLGRNIIDVAILRIKDVRANFSVGEIVKNGGRIEHIKRGSKVENISEEYAQELISGGVFSGKRPSETTRRDNSRKISSKPEVKPKPSEQEDAEAQNENGNRYYRGDGVKQDYAEAVKWYRKSAEQGYAIAQRNLGNMYYNGYGVKQDYAEALRWYHRALEEMEKNGYMAHTTTGLRLQCDIAYMYENGYGTKKDIHKAIELYRSPAGRGVEDARKALKRLGAN